MIKGGLADQIANAVRAAVPEGFGQQAEKNLRAALEALFARADLITREEFEVQQAVLLRTREKLEQLEKLVSELESRAERK